MTRTLNTWLGQGRSMRYLKGTEDKPTDILGESILNRDQFK